jgi:D-aminopeptidase
MTRVVRSLGVAIAIGGLLLSGESASGQTRARARELGVAPGIFMPGANNAITDVAGVRVGHATIREGDSVRTGVTAILPHGENPFFSRVPAAIRVGNGFGKLLGTTQVGELGELETPILLTCTLCVWKAADAMVEWMLEQEGMAQVGSINPVVGETNDGSLNDIRSRPITREHVRAALTQATGGRVPEGSVGAGTGTVAFGWKGGIGTSSRVLPQSLGGHAIGVLVQSNFGGVLQVMGAPVGRELGRYSFRDAVEQTRRNDGPRRDSVRGFSSAIRRLSSGGPPDGENGDGSIMIVVATDAPLSDRNLDRLALRAIMGLARTGSAASNGSGDYVIAFSTAESVRRRPAPTAPGAPPPDRLHIEDLTNDATTALFQAVVEATEEAIYNSMFMATSVTARRRTVEAISLDQLREVLRKYNIGRQ